MKVLKWLAVTLGVLVLVIGVGVAALVYLVDWNDFRDTIQNQVRKHTGRELEIAGDLDPSVFPWVGISIGEISLANAEGFGEAPFARVGSADVKVELLPLLRRAINIRTVELNGLELDLQRAADGSTNWDDLVDSSTTATTTVAEGAGDAEVVTEVEGSSATIAALAVGGIEISDANVSWRDAQSGTDAALSDFDLVTGAIELEKPFEFTVDFAVASDSMDLAADVNGRGEVTIDLDDQTYTLAGFTLAISAKGAAIPGGALEATLGADVTAALGEQRIELPALSLAALGVTLSGEAEVSDLGTEPLARGRLASETFSPRALMERLGIEPPATADEGVLGGAALVLAFVATPESATLEELRLSLDDTTLEGTASVPALGGAGLPPLRFDLAVDAIDVDRYLPPAGEGQAPAPEGEGGGGDDTPIALPSDLLRGLDVDGTLRVGRVKVANLETRDIVVPVKAANGRVAVESLGAALYEGRLDATAAVDASGATPGYALDLALEGIQAEPLLVDLMQKDAFLAGAGRVAASITTGGDTLGALKRALDGRFETAFTDGAINGINLGYQLRRAKAALSGNSLSEDEREVKTDFSSLTLSGRIDDGVVRSDDLDMRSPLLRVNGAGTVDLPGEAVDYTLTTLVTATAQGQGGAELESLKGLKLDIPVRASFAALAENPAGVIFDGLKANLAGNLANEAKARAEAEAEKLKAEAEARLKEKEAEAREALKAKEEELKRQLDEKVGDEVKDRLRGLLK